MKQTAYMAVACLTLSACAAQPAHHRTPANGAHTIAKAHTLKGYPDGAPRAGTAFAKVRLGMGRAEVTGLIGPPTSQHGHITGKQFIPFYFGGDTFRSDWYYRGQGELVFSQSHYGSSQEQLITIAVEPGATGYPK